MQIKSVKLDLDIIIIIIIIENDTHKILRDFNIQTDH